MSNGVMFGQKKIQPGIKNGIVQMEILMGVVTVGPHFTDMLTMVELLLVPTLEII